MGWDIDSYPDGNHALRGFVLIVEDSDDVAPLEIALESLCGLYTRTVKNGRDALEILRSGTAELAAVITDLNLPLADGFEVISAVRSRSGYANLPVIVVSGDDDPVTQKRVRSLGANAFFAKPYSPSALRHTLEGLLHAQ